MASNIVLRSHLVRSSLQNIVDVALLRRMLPDGGCADRLGGAFQVDSTAWRILAFRACGGSDERLERLCALLARERSGDGWVV
jgi:hypothetical protein